MFPGLCHIQDQMWGLIKNWLPWKHFLLVRGVTSDEPVKPLTACLTKWCYFLFIDCVYYSPKAISKRKSTIFIHPPRC